eukprot:365999-Chlamydomonas_euryale.AAC.7
MWVKSETLSERALPGIPVMHDNALKEHANIGFPRERPAPCRDGNAVQPCGKKLQFSAKVVRHTGNVAKIMHSTPIKMLAYGPVLVCIPPPTSPSFHDAP